MRNEFKYDLIIRPAVEEYFPELLQGLGNDAHLWIRAQIWQESRMNHRAVSPAGARGLMQLMPATAVELGVENVFDPNENIRAGIGYMSRQWQRLTEIPTPLERIRYALASYNGGRGYINMAMVLAREAEGLGGSHSGWRIDGMPPGNFQQWKLLKGYLADSRCLVRGRHPDYRQMHDYVAKIEKRYRHYRTLQKGAMP
ncbi:MAG: transglycosylase SLT domain-containing protein [Desulfuromusa sp.]